jgi:hypothetical protein
MKFDWSKFTESDYAKYMENRTKQNDYVGTVHVGDISIDLVSFESDNLLIYDFYVAHEDTGYGYKNFPYDYADGDGMNVSSNFSYNEFKSMAEKLFEDYIRTNDRVYGYSLVEHANRPLEVW